MVAAVAGAWLATEPPAANAEDGLKDPGFFSGLIPSYPDSWGRVTIADRLEVSGMPMQMATFRTSDSPERVVDFYAKAFAAEGMEVQVTDGEDTGGGGVVGWDARTRIRKQVMVLHQGGETQVFPSVVHDAAFSSSGGGGPLPPAPDGSVLISEVTAQDGPVASRTLSMVTERPVDVARSSLVARLRARGYEVHPTRKTPAGLMLEARDTAGRILTYTLNGGEGRPTGVTVIVRAGLE